MENYPVSKRNKAKRFPERAHYDVKTISDLIDSSLICHIAYVVDGQPYCTPTVCWRQGDYIVWHGSAGGKMARSHSQRIDVCLTVDFLDSIVLTRSAFSHAVNYRCAMIFGKAEPITDPDEKLEAVRQLIDNFLPGRSDLVVPPEPFEVKQATFLRMSIEEATAKIRNYPASHESEEFRDHPVWAGEIMIETRIGPAIPCTELKPGIGQSPDVELYKEGARLDSTLLEIRRAGRTKP